MDIVPTGKIRIMEAQSVSNPFSQGYIHPEETQDMFSNINMDQEIPQKIEEIPQEQIQEETQQPEEKTIENYIFKKLESFGWPGRLLQEYKDKFTHKSISADGSEEVKTEILDKHYPDMKTISRDELKEIVKEIQDSFGLHFEGGENNEGKWSLRFSSKSDEAQTEESRKENDMGATTYLDNAYGTPANKSNKNIGKKASFLDMIKEEKEKFVKNYITNYLSKIYKKGK
ncbi:MAG TPA: hypothetical protein VMZ91_02960 [Candidatus Paceibacterota bacterium]|nr:hypothetical protein [Candidatus Paceibacterota bacterium]